MHLYGRVPVLFRCRHCPADRVLLRVSDAGGRRQEVRRIARALATQASADHERLFGHRFELVEEVGGALVAVKINA